VFYVGYLPAELMRRKGRTILTMLGLALGVGLVVANASLSEAKEIAGLDGAAAVSSGLSLQSGAPGGQGARDRRPDPEGGDRLDIRRRITPLTGGS
jgi:ABC-type antimicrobial peptide transport system permease subunit